MNTLKMIAEIKQTCGVLEAEKAELVARVKSIDDNLTGYRMAIESLEMTIPKKQEPAKQAEAVQAPAKQKNGRVAALIEYKGERKTISEWADITGVNIKTLRYRLNHGYSVSDAMAVGNLNHKKQKKPNKIFAFDARGNKIRQYQTISAASKDLKLPESTIKAIIGNMSKEDQLKSRSYYLSYEK